LIALASPAAVTDDEVAAFPCSESTMRRPGRSPAQPGRISWTNLKEVGHTHIILWGHSLARPHREWYDRVRTCAAGSFGGISASNAQEKKSLAEAITVLQKPDQGHSAGFEVAALTHLTTSCVTICSSPCGQVLILHLRDLKSVKFTL